MLLISERAWSISTPGSTRAITLQLWAEREVWAKDVSRGVQTSAFWGKAKPGGITPTTLKPLSEILNVVPLKSDFPPSTRRQKS
jgi:hypothetical protein